MDANAAVATAEQMVDDYSVSIPQVDAIAAQIQLEQSAAEFLANVSTLSGTANFQDGLPESPISADLVKLCIEPISLESPSTSIDPDLTASTQLFPVATSIASFESSDSNSSSTLFGQNANLQAVADQLAESSYGDDPSSSSDLVSSADGGNSFGAAWQHFALPEGVAFDGVHLPAEDSLGDLLHFGPIGENTFSHSDITEIEQTIVTVTIAQTYVDSEHWMVSQSWTKQYQAAEVTGDPTAAWINSSRTILFSISITVSQGLGSTTASSSSAYSNGSSAPASSYTPIGPVATVTYSASDTQTESMGDSEDNSNPSAGTVDTMQYSGTSTLTANLSVTFTEFVVMLPDGSLGTTHLFSGSGGESRALNFQGSYLQFEATGTVLDASGSPTTATTHPNGSTFNSPGQANPPTAGQILDGTSALVYTGGNGSRISSNGTVNLSASQVTSWYITGEATVADGLELEESDISGTTGMSADSSGTITVTDDLQFDLQWSDNTVPSSSTGDLDYLSVGWKNNDSATANNHFSAEVSLADADLPESGGGTTTSTSTPTPGNPVVDVHGNDSITNDDHTWLLANHRQAVRTLIPANVTDTTLTFVASVKVDAGASTTANVTMAGWTPVLVVCAQGNVSAKLMVVDVSEAHKISTVGAAPAGYVATLDDRLLFIKSSETIGGTIAFDLSATLSPIAAPTMSGWATISASDITNSTIGQWYHSQFQSLSKATAGEYLTHRAIE